VGFIAGGQTGRGLVAAHIAGTWLRSHRMQSQVYDAMVSRGYTGEAYSLDDFHAGLLDGILISTALVALIGTLWVNRLFH
jgi:energy-coupling factor transporter transmembrane protein EcfT